MYVRELDISEFHDFVGLADCTTAIACLTALERRVHSLAQFVIEFTSDDTTAAYGRRYSKETALIKHEYLQKQVNNSVAMLLRRHCRHDSLNWSSERWNDLLYELLASYSASFDEFRAKGKDLRRMTPAYCPHYWPDYWVHPFAYWANKKYNR